MVLFLLKFHNSLSLIYFKITDLGLRSKIGFLKFNIINNFKIEIVYKPAWTTDWMTQETKEKLRDYGISPPEKNASCPQCKSKEIELISEFGATACKSMYKCNDCLEPFEHFKCI